jgi:hypothetical protein
VGIIWVRMSMVYDVESWKQEILKWALIPYWFFVYLNLLYSFGYILYRFSTSEYFSTILTEVFPCFYLSCKANARVQFAKTGHGLYVPNQTVKYYVYLCFCCMFCMLLFNCVNYVSLLLRLCILVVMCVIHVMYSVSSCCSEYCLCVNVYWTTAIGCQPNCS